MCIYISYKYIGIYIYLICSYVLRKNLHNIIWNNFIIIIIIIITIINTQLLDTINNNVPNNIKYDYV